MASEVVEQIRHDDYEHEMNPSFPRKRSGFAASFDAFGDNGGVYLPPAKRRQLEAAASTAAVSSVSAFQNTTSSEGVNENRNNNNNNRNSAPAIQRQTWQEEKRVVHGTINRLNTATIKPLIHDLFAKVNLIRLRGVLAKSILMAAGTSPQYSNVYAALVAVINTKLPEVGELVVKRAILAFRRHYRRREKAQCVAMTIFLAHLFHQAVVHELLILQILTVLLDGDPTDDSVEVAIQLLTTVGYALLEVSPAGVRAVVERLRAFLHEGTLNKRVEYKLEQLLALRKTGFRDYPPIPDDLDLVERDDQITFELSLDDESIEKEESLDVFRVDPDYEENELVWKKIQAEVLGLNDNGDDETDDDDDDDGKDNVPSTDDGDEPGNIPESTETALVPATSTTVVVQDLSEADLVHLRRTIYLTIMSSASFEECTHKLTKIDIPTGREEELINMIIECCSQERTFLRYYGLIAARFCLLDNRWRDAFIFAFTSQYMTIHRLETNKLRNVAKLFAHLLHTDSLPWTVLSVIHLNEDETTSSSRIFLKILVQEMAEAIGIANVKKRFETDDPILAESFKHLFPKDNVRNTRYAINFFTSIGLGPLTDGLREFLKNAPKMIMAEAQQSALVKKDDDDSDSSSVSSSSTSSSETRSSSSSSSRTCSSYTSSSSASTSSSYPSRRGGSRRKKGGNRRRYSSSSATASDSGSSSYSKSSSPPRRRRTSRRSYSSDSRSTTEEISRPSAKPDRQGRADRRRRSDSKER